ncbi:MAG TPA: hypothetical protein VJU83_09460 [Burkholderiales bacterium]|nr:hypothetical protein [Burkholderiales bacterium]
MGTLNAAIAQELHGRHERLHELERVARDLVVGPDEQTLLDLAIEVFGSEAVGWLLDEPPIMGGKTPLELLSDPADRHDSPPQARPELCEEITPAAESDASEN